MKKLILMLFILIGLTSCRYETPINGIIIHDIIKYDDIHCRYESAANDGTSRYYTTSTSPFSTHWCTSIIDSCGKYNIGDTIIFKKY